MNSVEQAYTAGHNTRGFSRRSSATLAFKSVFVSPNWLMNVVWLSIAVLLQSIIVGQFVLYGIWAEQIRAEVERPGSETPDIDSNRIGEYLQMGLWPFLVHLLTNFASLMLAALPLGIFVGLAAALAAPLAGEATAATIAMLTIPLILLLSIALLLIQVPFLLRSVITQDFISSFDLAWAKHFLRTMSGEIVLSSIRFGVLALGVYLLGTLAFCIGQIPAAGIVVGAAMNLGTQWYSIYLERGGIPVEFGGEEQIVEATPV